MRKKRGNRRSHRRNKQQQNSQKNPTNQEDKEEEESKAAVSSSSSPPAVTTTGHASDYAEADDEKSHEDEHLHDDDEEEDDEEEVEEEEMTVPMKKTDGKRKNIRKISSSNAPGENKNVIPTGKATTRPPLRVNGSDASGEDNDALAASSSCSSETSPSSVEDDEDDDDDDSDDEENKEETKEKSNVETDELRRAIAIATASQTFTWNHNKKSKHKNQGNKLSTLLPGYTAPHRLDSSTSGTAGKQPSKTTSLGNVGSIAALQRQRKKETSSASAEPAPNFKSGSKRPPDGTAGEGWFSMTPTPLTEELKADLATIKNRNYLDPKRFYKSADKNHGGKKQIYQLGTVIEGAGEHFRSNRLTKKQRRANITEEIMADESTGGYATNKFKNMMREKNEKALRGNGKRKNSKNRMKMRGRKGY